MTDKRFNRKKKIKALINDPYYQPMKQREIGYRDAGSSRRS